MAAMSKPRNANAADAELLEAVLRLQPTRLPYSHPLTAPLRDCFNWDEVLAAAAAAAARSTSTVGECHCEPRKSSSSPAETGLDAAEADTVACWYVVAFRSVRKTDANSELLYVTDVIAHAEALASGGLIKYWYGVPNQRRECLATCIWRSREDAQRALFLPKHIEAMRLTSQMYESYALERYWLLYSRNSGLSFEKIDESNG